jgi:hypothetical protein
VLTLEDDAAAGEALIRPVMRRGERVAAPSLEDARRLAREQLERLPAQLGRLDTEPAYPVEVSARLRRWRARSTARKRRGGETLTFADPASTAAPGTAQDEAS